MRAEVCFDLPPTLPFPLPPALPSTVFYHVVGPSVRPLFWPRVLSLDGRANVGDVCAMFHLQTPRLGSHSQHVLAQSVSILQYPSLDCPGHGTPLFTVYSLQASLSLCLGCCIDSNQHLFRYCSFMCSGDVVSG